MEEHNLTIPGKGYSLLLQNRGNLKVRKRHQGTFL